MILSVSIFVVYDLDRFKEASVDFDNKESMITKPSRMN
jgi:hypothetical protein